MCCGHTTYSHILHDGLCWHFVAGPDDKDGAGLLVLDLIGHNLVKYKLVALCCVDVGHTINENLPVKCTKINASAFDTLRQTIYSLNGEYDV